MPFELLTSIEATERIGIDRSTLSRWVQIGKIQPAHKLPGKTGLMFFEEAEVERMAVEYAAEKEERAAAATG